MTKNKKLFTVNFDFLTVKLYFLFFFLINGTPQILLIIWRTVQPVKIVKHEEGLMTEVVSVPPLQAVFVTTVLREQTHIG